MKKQIGYLLFFSSIVVLLIGIYMYTQEHKHNGKVIILNGPSASGKSSIQREFQKIMMPNLCVKVGIDNLFDAPMPDITLENIDFWQKKNPIRWVQTTQDNDHNSVITLYTGEQGERVAYAMNSAIAAYAKNGCNVIVDYIAYKKEWLDDLHSKLQDFDTYWVKITLPLLVLEQREEARKTSPKGHGRSHYDYVHWNMDYDAIFDTSQKNAKSIAEELKQMVS